MGQKFQHIGSVTVKVKSSEEKPTIKQEVQPQQTFWDLRSFVLQRTSNHASKMLWGRQELELICFISSLSPVGWAPWITHHSPDTGPAGDSHAALHTHVRMCLKWRQSWTKSLPLEKKRYTDSPTGIQGACLERELNCVNYWKEKSQVQAKVKIQKKPPNIMFQFRSIWPMKMLLLLKLTILLGEFLF